MKKSEFEKYCKKIEDVLGTKRLNYLHEFQEKSLNNQLHDLFEEHNHIVDTITNEEIIGRYDLVTKHIYPNDLIQTL